MTTSEIRAKMDEIIDKNDTEFIDNEIEQLLEAVCFKVLIHAPHLDEELRPEFVPLNDSENKCPHADKLKEQKCMKCPYFVAYKSETGEVFAYNIFKSYCAKSIEE